MNDLTTKPTAEELALLPASVRAAFEEDDDANGTQPEPTDAPVEGGNTSIEAPADNADGASAPPEQPDPVQPASDLPQAPAEGSPAGEDLNAAVAKMQQELRVLQGKYNAEVPRLAAEKRELREQLQAKETLIAQLEERVKAAQAAPAPAATTAPVQPKADLAALAEKYNFDEDTIRTIYEISEQTAAAKIEALSGQFKTVQEQAQEARRNIFVRDLTQLVPNVMEVDADQSFRDWASRNFPPFSELTYGQLLIGYGDSFDAQKAANVYNAYLASTAGAGEASATASAPAAAPAALVSSKVAQQVMPSTKGTAVKPQGGKAKMSEAEYLARYDAITNRLRSGQLAPADADTQMKQLDAAYAAQ